MDIGHHRRPAFRDAFHTADVTITDIRDVFHYVKHGYAADAADTCRGSTLPKC